MFMAILPVIMGCHKDETIDDVSPFILESSGC